MTTSPPLIRYLVINMADKLEVELGVPVATDVPTDDGVSAGVLPPGRYASLVYSGDYSGLMSANKALLDWGAEQGLVLGCIDHGQGRRLWCPLRVVPHQPSRRAGPVEVADTSRDPRFGRS